MTIPDLTNVLLFIIASIFLIITPGPAIVYIIARTVEKGYKAGILSVLGIEAGTFIHVVSITIGFSEILIHSRFGFTILKYGGVFYLIILGMNKILKTKGISKKKKKTKEPSKNVFFGGLIISFFNPKSILFFIVFLPQFITISKKGEASQILFLGLIFILIAILWGIFVVSIYTKFIKYFKRDFFKPNTQSYVIGAIYIGIGLFSLMFFTKM